MTLLPKVKLKTLVSFPAAVFGGVGLAVRKENGQFFFDLALDELGEVTTINPDVIPTTHALLWESTLDTYRTINLPNLQAIIGGGGSGGGIPDAPNDGNQYGRQALAWTPVQAPPFPADAPSDGFTYGRLNGAWAQAASPALINSSIAAALGGATLRRYLSGLTLSTPGGSAAFSVATGIAADSNTTVMMMLAAALTKTTAAWAVGNNNGGLDTGAIAANTWYHVHLIKRLDTGVVDALVSLSPSAPTLPANYTVSRRIGSMLTNGSVQWAAFVQLGDEFLWVASVGDSSGALATTALNIALTVPTGLQVNALIRATYSHPTAGQSCLITSLDQQTEIVASVPGNVTITAANSNPVRMTMNPRTNTAAQIRAVALSSGGTLSIVTFGWTDRRGRDF